MKKTNKISILLLIICMLACVAALAACGKTQTPPAEATQIANGGFEKATLEDWTIEYGSAFDEDCISSVKTFRFDGDNHDINIGQTGNWYLTGKTYWGGHSGEETGAIRSKNFTIGKDGVITMKLAGGALATGKGSTSVKDSGKICYVGVYRASDDLLIAMQRNDYFNEHTEDYVQPDKYESGVYLTDNFYEYTLDLSDYAGTEAYIRIVDNDDSNYYGYIAVDDIRVGEDADAQEEGTYAEKTHTLPTDVEAPSKYEIKNGGFETGNLAGWTVVSGEAFADAGVNSKSTWWAENIPYCRDGNYHYGVYNRTATGVMRSSEFELGGSGYISWKMGGCRDNSTVYLRFMVKGEDGAEDEEIARYSNFMFKDIQFPYVQNGMKLLNLVQYYADFSEYLGSTMYIEVVDNNTAEDDNAALTLDSVKTYWEQKPTWYTSEAFEAYFDNDDPEDTEYQIKNGGFESGDLTGWTPSWTEEEQAIGVVTDTEVWWGERLPYNRSGKYHFSGNVTTFNADAEAENKSYEGNTGTLTSEAFTVAGSGYITFKLGGGGNFEKCYVSIIDAETEGELLRFANLYFSDLNDLSFTNKGGNLANMVFYKADLSSLKGRSVKIRLVDNATDGWGLFTADSFVTYYRNASNVPAEAKPLPDMITFNDKLKGSDGGNQVLNGDFETGTMYGWESRGDIMGISSDNIWWAENILHNKDGEYFASGWATGEGNTGTLTSKPFLLGGIGYITFKFAGGRDASQCYIEIIDAETGAIYAKFANTLFNDANFSVMGAGTVRNPKNAEDYGVFLANLALFKADLRPFIGKRLRIRITDNATADWGVVFADSFVTYYENEDDLPTEHVHEAKNLMKVLGEDDEHQVLNGDFETGTLEGWTFTNAGTESGGIESGGISGDTTYWGEQLPFNKSGNFFVNGWTLMDVDTHYDDEGHDIGHAHLEADSWALKSGTFKVGGSGYMSVKMGGNAAAIKVYKENGDLIGTYRSTHFSDTYFPFEGDGEGKGSWGGMRTYFIDLSDHMGETLYVELCDTGAGAWGVAFFDDVITYYEETPDIDSGYDTVRAPIGRETPGDDKTPLVYGEVQLKWRRAQKEEA